MKSSIKINPLHRTYVKLEYLDGSPFSYQDLKTKTYIVSFWATYCSPCIEKFPLLNEIAQSNESLEIIMISDEKTDLLKTFLQHREDISELHFLKHQGKNADIGINLLPTTLFVENGIHKIISNKDLESFLE